MARLRMQLSTGLPKLDHVLRGLMAGDNIVWQVDSIDEYLPFVEAYAARARETRQSLIYFRFAEHKQLLPASENVHIIRLSPDHGFEPFIAEIHRVITKADRGSLYLFDCLSELAAGWNSDRMLGNFFMLTCPQLYDLAAVAYFAILRNYHSFHATRPITNTTQILIDAFRRKGQLYIHPLKVQHRHSATMYMLHVRDGDDFIPVTQSCAITETMAGMPWSRQDLANARLGYWSRMFAEAEAVYRDYERGVGDGEQVDLYFNKLVRMLISHDEKVLRIAEKYFTLKDLLAIRKRMIGTGLIGGKSVGMLLARAILTTADRRWENTLEVHDSFFVGADVFYTYLVQNGCWWMMQKHKMGSGANDEIETVRRRTIAGEFPEYIVVQFADMLDYFGQSPIIVRSSSLLEDNFGNAFAGKYESVFCANQGGQHKRLEDFLCAVRTVYASTMSEEALAYREKRGLLQNDEQMALLIQRVSGATYGHVFYPQAAGVGFSFNPYVWHEDIDAEAGMVRLVFGVGTRAVERADDDYTRIVALNAPSRRPEATFDEVREYAQRRVDVIDLEANHLTSASFEETVNRSPGVPLEMFASQDRNRQRQLPARQRGISFPWVLTFDRLLSATQYVTDMKSLLQTLAEAYEYPVDVEFTLNFFEPESYKINLVQCRPLQVTVDGEVEDLTEELSPERVLVQSAGPVIGRSYCGQIDWIIYVTPSAYATLTDSQRYGIARVISDLTHLEELADSVILLMGPGRWGTTTPSLGVPVTFADILSVSILCEIVTMRETLVPDVSLGTHFFNELVENNMLYLAVFPNRDGHILNNDLLEQGSPNLLPDVLPEHREWAHVVRLIRASDAEEKRLMALWSNTLKQRVVCYREADERR